MVRRTKEQALETRNKILAAATAIFDRRSWKEVNLEDVAAAAGVTRGAIYWHFGGKDKLFDAVCDATPLPLELIGAEVALALGPDPLGKFRGACLSALMSAAESPGRATLYSTPSTKEELLDPGGVLLLRHRIPSANCKRSVQMVLRAAVEQGQLPVSLDIEPAARYLHGTLTGLLSAWLLAPSSFDLISEAGRALDAVFFGLRSAPSMQKVQVR
jgi:TetR/AcrR family acrAB operon transcriptional repressor